LYPEPAADIVTASSVSIASESARTKFFEDVKGKTLEAKCYCAVAIKGALAARLEKEADKLSTGLLMESEALLMFVHFHVA
jgi:hypothetical protein